MGPLAFFVSGHCVKLYENICGADLPYDVNNED